MQSEWNCNKEEKEQYDTTRHYAYHDTAKQAVAAHSNTTKNNSKERANKECANANDANKHNGQEDNHETTRQKLYDSATTSKSRTIE